MYNNKMNKLLNCCQCKKNFNNLMRICPFCGAENKKSVIKEIPVCPICGNNLKTKKYREQNIEICSTCYGLWLDSDEFAYLTSERDTFIDETIAKIYRKPAVKDFVKYKKCVRCGKLMTRKMFKYISGVVIDICIDHGVWLDKGELKLIRIFIANGGLEKNQEHLDNKINSNHDAIKKLANEVGDVKFIQKMSNLYNPRYWLFKLMR